MTNITIRHIDTAPLEHQQAGEAQATMWALNTIHEKLYLPRRDRRRSLDCAIEGMEAMGLIEARGTALNGIVATLTDKGRKAWAAAQASA